MRVELAHSTIHYREIGEGTPVVWVHGYPLSSRIWDPQIDIPGVRHLLPDLPGFGESPAPGGDLSMDDYADGVIAVLDSAGVRTAVVAGLSMGGYIAFALARKAMERLGGLILVDTRETADTEDGKRARFESIETVRAKGLAPIVDGMLPKLLTAKTMKDHPETTERTRRIMESATPEGVIAALAAMAKRPDSAGLLPTIEVPTLIAVGKEDSLTPPADAERMRAAIPGAELAVIDGAAHLSNFEKADAFNEAVSDFLERRQPTR